ncbi:MAG: hypothetical protein HWE25_12000 [Alphaproteobacteria bacterium]|nr:hypothetical protein [Alphaproteobacteria bacterium]
MSEKDTDQDKASDETEPEILEARVIHESPEPEAASRAPVAPPKKASFAAKAGWSVAALLAAFTGGVYLAPQFAPGLQALGIGLNPPAQPGTGTTVDLSPLQADLANMADALARHQEILGQHEMALKAAADENAALKNDLAVLASSGAAVADNPTDPAAIATLRADIGRLTDDVARLSSLSGTQDPNVTQLTGALALARAEVAQLKSRLGTLESAMQAVQAGALEASPRGRLVLALGRMKDQAVMGQPYGAALSALRPDFAALPALDQQMIGADIAFLEARGSGITPFEGLLAEFDSVAAAAITAADKAEGGFLANLFTVRRTDAGATGIDAQILKAERHMAARDVGGAVQALEELQGPALDATADWRQRASDYAGVMQAFDRLTMRVATSGNANTGAVQ